MKRNFTRTMTMRKLSSFHTAKDNQKVAALPLNVVLILGSTRCQGPPYPAPLGKRVGLYLKSELTLRGHNVIVIDPLLIKLELLRKPHFAYAPLKVPAQLKDIAEKVNAADVYVMCTPEYNHAPSPALLNVLNHFGSSLFSFKPSCIVSYSAGQWGGTRAAHALRPILSELGCIPVSAMIHIPCAQDVLDELGNVLSQSNTTTSTPGDGATSTRNMKENLMHTDVKGEGMQVYNKKKKHGEEEEEKESQESAKWRAYAGRTFSQLEWWGQAARRQRHDYCVDPAESSPVFLTNPSQRNAP